MAASFDELLDSIDKALNGGADAKDVLPLVTLAAEHPKATQPLREFHAELSEQARRCAKMAEWASDAAAAADAGTLPTESMIRKLALATHWASNVLDHDFKSVVFRAVVRVALAAGCDHEKLLNGRWQEWLVLEEKCRKTDADKALKILEDDPSKLNLYLALRENRGVLSDAEVARRQSPDDPELGASMLNALQQMKLRGKLPEWRPKAH